MITDMPRPAVNLPVLIGVCPVCHEYRVDFVRENGRTICRKCWTKR